MGYRTINLREETYRRLTMYKVAGKSYDDVIQNLIGRVSEEEFLAEELELHRKRLAEMKRGKFQTVEEMERSLERVRKRGNLKSKRK